MSGWIPPIFKKPPTQVPPQQDEDAKPQQEPFGMGPVSGVTYASGVAHVGPPIMSEMDAMKDIAFDKLCCVMKSSGFPKAKTWDDLITYLIVHYGIEGLREVLSPEMDF